MDGKSQSLVEDKYHIYGPDGKLLVEKPVKESELEGVKQKLQEQGLTFTVRQILFS